jgi:TPP-dependent pyruvate/acetoin dehydrogenase alpha subunit
MSSIKFKNAFEAITDNKEEAKQLTTSADLIMALRDVVEEKGWNSEEAINLVSAKIKEAIEDTIQTRQSLSQTLDKISTK